MADDCLFCKVVAGEVPGDIVHEGELVIAFRDINPQAPTHILVVPRGHHENVGALAEDEPDALVELARAVKNIAAEEGYDDYRLVFNTGASAQQSVFHVHGHVLAGRSMTWPPG